MNEGIRRRLLDAVEACDAIEFETLGFDANMFVSVSTTAYAVNWLLTVLGESMTTVRVMLDIA